MQCGIDIQREIERKKEKKRRIAEKSRLWEEQAPQRLEEEKRERQQEWELRERERQRQTRTAVFVSITIIGVILFCLIAVLAEAM